MNKPDGAAWTLRIAYWKLQSQVVSPTTTQSHRETRKHSRVAVITAAIIFAGVLGGCGGGGGGGGPSSAAPDTSYPTLSNSVINSANGGVTANYSKTADLLTPLAGEITASHNAQAQSFSIAANLPGPHIFDFTVGLAALGTLDVNSPPSCANCLRAGPTDPASDGRIVSFIYLDPSIAGMSYSTLGLWSKPTPTASTDAGAAFSIGVVTRPQDLPILGNEATYNGHMVGRYSNGLKTFAVAADVRAVITFNVSGSSATLTTNNTRSAEEGTADLAVSASALDLTSPVPLTYSGTTNSVTGTLNAAGFVGITNMVGPATAKYYGPPTGPGATPAEFGGAFFVGNGQEQFNGSFVLRK